MNAAWSLQARAHNCRGLLFQETGHTNSAAAEFLKAVKLRQRRMEIIPQDFENQIYLEGTYCNLGQASLDLWETDNAVSYFVRSVDTLNDLIARCPHSFRQIAEAFLRNGEQGLLEARKWQATNCSPPELADSLFFEEAAPMSDSLPDAMPDPSVVDGSMDPADANAWYLKGMFHSGRASSAIAGGIHIHAFHFPAAMEALACFDKSQRIMPSHVKTLLAKARLLTRLARATDAKSKNLHHGALRKMNNQEASDRYVLPIRRRFHSYLLRAEELLEQVSAICPTNAESVLLKATLQREYPDLSES